MTREGIIRQLESPKEDAITHFNDDGDDEVCCSDVEAIEAVIAAFRQQQEQESKPLNGWISVHDRLPEDQEEVLVCTRSKNGIRNIDKGYMAIDRFIHRGRAEVTHWMPLPNPPKGE